MDKIDTCYRCSNNNNNNNNNKMPIYSAYTISVLCALQLFLYKIWK